MCWLHAEMSSLVASSPEAYANDSEATDFKDHGVCVEFDVFNRDGVEGAPVPATAPTKAEPGIESECIAPAQAEPGSESEASRPRPRPRPRRQSRAPSPSEPTCRRTRPSSRRSTVRPPSTRPPTRTHVLATCNASSLRTRSSLCRPRSLSQSAPRFRPPAHPAAGCATRRCATPAARPTASSAPAQRTVCRGELSREECPTGRALHGVHAHSARSGQSGGLSLRDASCEPPRNPPFYSTRRKSPKPFRSPAFRGRTLRRPGSGPPSAAPARPRILLQIGRSGGCLGPRLVISLAPTPRALIGWLLTIDCTTRVVLSALHWPDQPGPRRI